MRERKADAVSDNRGARGRPLALPLGRRVDDLHLVVIVEAARSSVLLRLKALRQSKACRLRATAAGTRAGARGSRRRRAWSRCLRGCGCRVARSSLTAHGSEVRVHRACARRERAAPVLRAHRAAPQRPDERAWGEDGALHVPQFSLNES